MRAATTFLTRLPVGGFPYTAAELGGASKWFPIVGAVIGLLLAITWYFAARLGSLPAAVFTLTAGVLITGGLHEDGLADTADALGGAHNREDVLRILKDSRIGSYGALALIISFTGRVALLASVRSHMMAVLICAQSVSRLPPVWLLATTPYVTPTEQSRSQGMAQASTAGATFASVCALGLLLGFAWSGWLPWAHATAVGFLVLAVIFFSRWWYLHRLGGVTGDLLGAVQQVTETALLAVFALPSA